MKVKVKICGIRDLDVAYSALQAGADFLGFNFVPTSKRYIDPSIAQKIVAKVRGKVLLVGVFQNAPAEQVNKIADLLDLEFVQLHGAEDEEYMKRIKSKIIKKVVIPNDTDKITYFLLDRDVQGEGKIVELETARNFSKRFPIFFAGGLTPKNIAGIVAKVQPYAVDVAGGIETDNKEDPEKIKSFIINAKGVI